MALTTLLPKTIRNAGSYISPDIRIPKNTTQYFLRALMDSSDIADTILSFTLKIEASYDSGTTWKFFAGGTYTCGRRDRSGNLKVPQISITKSNQTAPDLIRVILEIPKQLSVGLEREIS